MRIFNRMIVASALVVPMALGAAGVAAADVVAGSAMLPIPIGAADQRSGDCDHGDCEDEDDDEGLLSILGLGGDDDEDDGKDNEDCKGDDHHC